jgi:bifunctional DNA-binding transcriptional regulator/antitoxin component of YhaV-PrlF toxin-antitoxin module
MTDYIIEVQESEDGDLLITLPDDLIDTLGWQVGDVLDWRMKGESIILSRLNEGTPCDPAL